MSDTLKGAVWRPCVEIMQERAVTQRSKATVARRYANLPMTLKLVSRLPARMADLDERLADLDEELLLALREGR